MTRGPSNPLATAFRGQTAAPNLRMLRTPTLSLTEVMSDHHDLVVTGTVPIDDAYVVTLHLRTRPRGAMRAEGRWLEPQGFHGGNAGIADLRMKLVSEYAGAFHYVSFYLPQRALADLTDDAEVPRIGELRHYRLGVGFSDPVVRHLLMSVRPALALDPAEVSPLYADHVARALVAHMAVAYGDLRPPPAVRGGLTPGQERVAKELLDARLDGRVSLAELAAACRLSVRHFTRAFRETTGQSPHQWLTARRLEKAQVLLESSSGSLEAIASRCGFASRSHFTRVFTRANGTGPGTWRRVRR